MLKISSKKLVSDGEKLVSDFEHFQSPIPTHSKHYSWAGRFVDICQIISKLLSTIAIKSLNMAFAIGIKVIKNKKDTDNLMIINVFYPF